MRGVGNAVKPAVITFFAVCVLRMALLFTVTFPHLSVLTISICYPVTWAASSVLFILYYKFGRWMPRYPESANLNNKRPRIRMDAGAAVSFPITGPRRRP